MVKAFEEASGKKIAFKARHVSRSSKIFPDFL